ERDGVLLPGANDEGLGREGRLTRLLEGEGSQEDLLGHGAIGNAVHGCSPPPDVQVRCANYSILPPARPRCQPHCPPHTQTSLGHDAAAATTAPCGAPPVESSCLLRRDEQLRIRHELIAARVDQLLDHLIELADLAVENKKCG